MRRAVFGITLTLLLIGMLTLTFSTPPAKASGTIYIRADGSVDPPTAPVERDGYVYTLTGNITTDTDGIVIERDNIVVDGGGYILQGIGSGIGIDLTRRSNVTIKNTEIKSFNYGIKLYSWAFYYSSNNNIFGNNIANSCYGIRLYESSNNTLRNNNASNNKYNFGVYGWRLSHYIHDIDDSNTAHGKPVYYWVNKRNMTVPLDAGYVALINCTNITVRNLNLTNNGQGALLALTTNSTMTGNDMTENDEYGVGLFKSSNYNTISGNNIAENNWGGVVLDDSSNNNIAYNTGPIYLVGSLNNNITNNTGSIYLEYSSNNRISRNMISSGGYAGIRLVFSEGNIITQNNIANNNIGICLLESTPWGHNNTIYHNNFINNTNHVYDEAYEPYPHPFCGSENTWYNSYPSGGNYWSDYNGTDLYSGPNQDQPGSDGIGDTPYTIVFWCVNYSVSYQKDRYPLMSPWPMHWATTCSVWTTDADGNPKVKFDPAETVYVRWNANGMINMTVYAPDGVTTDQEWTCLLSSGVVSFVPSHGMGIYEIDCTGAKPKPIAIATFLLIPQLPFMATLLSLATMLGAAYVTTKKRKKKSSISKFSS